MKLKDGGWDLWRYRTETAGAESVCLIGTAGNQQDLTGLSNGLHPHRNGLTRNILLPVKKTGVGSDGAL